MHPTTGVVLKAMSELLNEKAEAFRADLPCISDAMKSYLSVVLAEGLTRAPEVQYKKNVLGLHFLF